ncbi:hypothetical protein V6N13_033871 [Hibiscus sabdariffa]
MELIDVGPRSEVPRVGKAVTIELNVEQRRIRQLSEINLSISSLVEMCEAERRLNKKGRGRPRKKPLPEQGIANASLSDLDFIQRQHRDALVVQDEDVVVESTGPGNSGETTCGSEGDSATSMQVGTATENETGSGNGCYCAEDMDFGKL